MKTCQECGGLTGGTKKSEGGPPFLCRACYLQRPRRCTLCGETKPVTEFHWDKRFKIPRSRCKACAQRTRIPETTDSMLRRRYGIDKAEWVRMHDAQGGRCAVCGTVPKRLVVDHDHKTGHVRGLVCDRCNHGLGFIEAGMVGAGTRYLQRSAIERWLTRTAG